jgi:hypothetical protein
MKAKYAVNKIAKNSVAVVENTPFEKVVVKIFKNEKTAQEFCTRLNKGFGFAGFTPQFIVDKEKQKV